MKKKTLSIIGLFFLLIIGIFLYEMIPFAKGIQTDIEKETYVLNNGLKTNVDITHLDSIKTNPLMHYIYLNYGFKDTIIQLKNDKQITLKQIDSVNITEYFIKKDIIDSICKVEGNRHSEALGIENYQLKKYSDFFKRDSTQFYVKLKNGEWKKLILNIENDEADHTFEYLFESFGFYSIRVQWGEGNGYKLINYSNGEVTRIIGRPYFSPNGKYIISINADLEAGYSENGFQLFENKNGVLNELIFYEPNLWGPYSAKWIDNNTVIMKNEGIEFNNETMRNFKFYNELKIINAG